MNLTVNGKENKAPPHLTLTPGGFNQRRRGSTPIHSFLWGEGNGSIYSLFGSPAAEVGIFTAAKPTVLLTAIDGALVWARGPAFTIAARQYTNTDL